MKVDIPWDFPHFKCLLCGLSFKRSIDSEQSWAYVGCKRIIWRHTNDKCMGHIAFNLDLNECESYYIQYDDEYGLSSTDTQTIELWYGDYIKLSLSEKLMPSWNNFAQDISNLYQKVQMLNFYS